METVFISGMGLIGSSIARVIRQKDETIKILAEDTTTQNLDYMHQSNLIDQVVDFDEGVKTADIVFLATPVSIIKKQLEQIATFKLHSKTIVTDVGSTKLSIMAAAKKMTQKNQQVRFIGGHPMSGSHLTGSQNGRQNLFLDAYYFLINANASESEILQLQDLLSESHSHFKVMAAEEHDHLVGVTSHLPHILATTLVNTASQELKDSSVGLETSANGFKKTTEIAQADEVMWQAIFSENKDVLLKQIKCFEQELDQFKTAIATDNQSVITNKIKQAKQVRQQL
ncbi:prephenate dehydrogenase [Holzapfeliella sp. JNUCC 72]